MHLLANMPANPAQAGKPTLSNLPAQTVSDISSSRRTTSTVGGARTTSPTRPWHLLGGAGARSQPGPGVLHGSLAGIARPEGPSTHWVTASWARTSQSRGWARPGMPAKPS